jgi:hypothetical protein
VATTPPVAVALGPALTVTAALAQAEPWALAVTAARAAARAAAPVELTLAAWTVA